MVPVDHVARIVVASTLHPPASPLGVSHVTPHPRLSWNDFLGSLEMYGYQVPAARTYEEWRDALLRYVEESEAEGSGKEPWAAYVQALYIEFTRTNQILQDSVAGFGHVGLPYCDTATRTQRPQCTSCTQSRWLRKPHERCHARACRSLYGLSRQDRFHARTILRWSETSTHRGDLGGSNGGTERSRWKGKSVVVCQKYIIL